MTEWEQVQSEYVRGASYRRLADKYGLSFSTLQKKGAAEGWTELRKKARIIAGEKIADAVGGEKANTVNLFDSIADKLLNMISDMISDEDYFFGSIGRLRDITVALKDLREIKGMKTELDLQEQMARIEKLRKEVSAEEENKEIHVVIDPSLEEYSK